MLPVEVILNQSRVLLSLMLLLSVLCCVAVQPDLPLRSHSVGGVCPTRLSTLLYAPLHLYIDIDCIGNH